jgi:hypothetical protein
MTTMTHHLRRSLPIAVASAAIGLGGAATLPAAATCADGLTIAGPGVVLVGEKAAYTATECRAGVEVDVTGETAFTSSRADDGVDGNHIVFPVQGLRLLRANRAGRMSPPLRVIAVNDAPVFSEQPTLDSYSPRVGRDLRVDPGVWEPSAGSVIAYQWLADGIPIAGATGVGYTPTVADLGQRLACRVVVRHEQMMGAGTLTTGASATVVPGTAAPLTVGIEGSGRVGTAWRALAEVPAPWGAPAYRWQRHGVDIPGATSAVYTAVADDIGVPITVRVTAERVGYEPATGVSAQVTGIVGEASSAAVSIAGTARTGKPLTAIGTPAAPWKVEYQWRRSGQPIAGATGPTYTPTAADAGKTLTLEARATAEGYEPAIWTPAVSIAKLTPKVTAKPVAKRVAANTRPKVRVTVRVPGIAAPVGTIKVRFGQSVKSYKLTAVKKGTITVRLPVMERGTSTVRAWFAGTSQIAKRTAKTFRLTAR